MGSGRDERVEEDAEIEVLLRLFGEDVAAMQRLSAVLARAPERFRQVVAQVDGAEAIEWVALLVRNLGRPAFESVVESYFDGEEQAQAVLLRLLGPWQDLEKLEHGWQLPLLPQAHMLCAVVMDAAQPVQARIGLLIDLLEHTTGKESAAEGVVPLYICMLRGFGEPAYELLLERFMRLLPQRKTTYCDPLIAALQAFTSPFARELTQLLRAVDRDRLALGLRGVEGLARPSWHSEGTTRERAYERRIRGVWYRDQIDAEAFDQMVAAVADVCAGADAAMRPWAMEVLGMVPNRAHTAVVRAGLRDEDPAVRLAAIMALADLRDPESVEELIACVREGDPLVRRRAVEALSHMRARAAKALLEELIDDPDAAVRKAAITNLADIGDAGSRARLDALMRGKDKKVARLAAQALFRWQGRTRETKKQQPKLLGTTGENLRGGEIPVSQLHRSVVAVMGGLPELRDYEEMELTRLAARVCGDYATVRRKLVSGRDALMRRAKGIYVFTELGAAVWQVEHFIKDHFLSLECY